MRLLAAASALLLLAGCASGLNRPVHEVTARVDASGVQHVQLVAHSFYFEPNRIVVRAEVPVVLRIRNAAWLTPHNFSISAPDAGLVIDQDLSWFGGTRTVRFTPKKPGTYTFACDKDGHAKKGMKGTLVVAL